MQSAAEAIAHLQALLAVYQEQEDQVVASLITQIRQRLEGMKACA